MRLVILVSFILFSASIKLEAQNTEFYKLKVYTFDTEEQAKVTDNFLSKHYLPAVKRLGIKNIGVFKSRSSMKDTILKTYVLIPSASISSLIHLDNILMEDNAYVSSASAYYNAKYDMPPYARIENIFMKAFEEMPNLKPSILDGPRKDRVYELRSYESATEMIFKNKMDMFNAGGEIKLFEQLGFNAVFYAEVMAGGQMPNLMYMTTHQDEEMMQKNWNTFREAPEWLKMKSMDKYQNNVSHIDKYLLYPTAYSDY